MEDESNIQKLKKASRWATSSFGAFLVTCQLLWGVPMLFFGLLSVSDNVQLTLAIVFKIILATVVGSTAFSIACWLSIFKPSSPKK